MSQDMLFLLFIIFGDVIKVIAMRITVFGVFLLFFPLLFRHVFS